MRGTQVVVLFNVLALVLVICAFIAMNRHDSAAIAAKKHNYPTCARQTRARLRKAVALNGGSLRGLRARIAATTSKRCGSAHLADQRVADGLGTGFMILALGLFDFLLWRIRKTGTQLVAFGPEATEVIVDRPEA